TQWLSVDLGANRTVEQVTIPWYSSYYAKAYRIQCSTDGSTWTDVYSTTSGTSGTKTHTFTARTARYVRLYCTSAESSNGYSVTEFGVWGR
ncbi:MAG: discoidin domain-containing protein, partial [Actinobacteria bacterium]